MAKTYSISEARAHLPTIVDEAESGQRVELTRRGEPVAVVISHQEFERLQGRRKSFGDAYREFLGTHSLDEVGSPLDFADSIRDRTTGRKVPL